ncbi:MAG: hypothetical protein ACOZEN_01135 [Thermodesulfobacteriota bacterium]
MSCRYSSFTSPGRVAAAALLLICLAVGACSAARHPVGHVKRALDPAGFPQAASSAGWDVAAVRVTTGPGGLDYSGTQLLPVLLVLKNKSSGQPQVILEDIRAIGANAEYLVYGADEAMRLATASTFSRKAGSAARSGAVGAGVGAALGAGAGAVLYAFTGQKNPEYLWMGAAAGGAAGTLAGAAVSDSSFSKQEQDTIRADLTANVWQEDPITPGTTRTGYILLPAGLDIASIRIVIRTDSAMETKTLKIASEKDYNPGSAETAALTNDKPPARQAVPAVQNPPPGPVAQDGPEQPEEGQVPIEI